MKSKLFIILSSSIASLALFLSGAYFIIKNLFIPDGFMFEGVVMFSIGLLISLMIAIALSIGETILLFGKILEQQVEIQKEMSKMSNNKNPMDISSIISRIMPNADITITDLNSNSGTNIPIDIDMIKNIIAGGKKNNIKDMELSELEDELSKAVKSEDFERAEKINKAIKEIKNPDKNEDDENN